MNYSYTINISPKKYVANQQWGKYSNKVQKELLTAIINGVVESFPFIEEHEFIYELTNLKMIHAHGTMYCDLETIESFREKIHKKVGMPHLDPQIACFIDFSKKGTTTHWKEYMAKDQDNQLLDDCLFRNYNKITKRQK